MDEQTSKIVAQTVANLAEVAARNTVGAISHKIKTVKTSKEKDKIVSELEEIINDLITDKIELERIAKTLEKELVSQQISDSDISFIVDSVIPLVRELTKDDKKQQEYISYVEKLLSKEFLTVMQLIGFNYREAIGKPLTALCATAITRMASDTNESDGALATIKNQTALAQLSADREAYNRFVKLLGRADLLSEDPAEKSTDTSRTS